MTLHTEAQELIVLEPTAPHPIADAHDTLIPLEVIDTHAPEAPSSENIEVCEPVDIHIVVEDLPGAPGGTKDPEPVLEVHEEDEKSDENEAKKSKKPEKWDWSVIGKKRQKNTVWPPVVLVELL